MLRAWILILQEILGSPRQLVLCARLVHRAFEHAKGLAGQRFVLETEILTQIAPDGLEGLFQREPLAERAGLLQAGRLTHREGQEERPPGTQVLDEVVRLDSRDGLRILGLALLAQDPRILFDILGLLQLVQSLLDHTVAGWGEGTAHHGPRPLLPFLDLEEDDSTSQHVDQLEIAGHGWVIDQLGQWIVARSDKCGAGCAHELPVPVDEIGRILDSRRVEAHQALHHARSPRS